MTKDKQGKQREEPTEVPDAPAPASDAPETAERDDLLARLQRVSADYVNYQKRVQREIAEAGELANAELIRDLLAVVDDMERAMSAAEEQRAADDPLLAGMRLLHDKALEVLGRYGLKPIQAEGQPFDPTRHEAVMQQQSAEHETPTVLAELQRGYELKGRVLRPARVVVAVPPAKREPPPAEEKSGGANESE